MKLFLLEPFYGGSHKLWADQIRNYSRHDIQLFTMPARFWKWRMRGSAIHLAEKVNQEPAPDLLLVSDMIDLALFKNLYKNKEVPVILYMHENQFAYPDNDEEDFTYAFANYASTLVADAVIWNSQYNMRTFLEGCEQLLRRLPDYAEHKTVDRIQSRSSVLYPTLPEIKALNSVNTQNDIPVLLWNHRWEHDKNPEAFFPALYQLMEENIEFQLIVLGESYETTPAIFAEAKEKLKNNIIHWGYVESRNVYENMLRRADILPVTSAHDFFGISVWEAVREGVFPLLPRRLTYPEILSSEKDEAYFYDRGEFNDTLKKVILLRPEVNEETLIKLDALSIENYIGNYDDFFEKFRK